MRGWFTPAEIVAARSPELPGTVRGINVLADAKRWRADPARARRRAGRGGGWEYHASLLPAGAQARLALMNGGQTETPPYGLPAISPSRGEISQSSKALWARFEVLSKAHKDECHRRLVVLDDVERKVVAGFTETAAIAAAGATHGVSARTVFNWRRMVAGVAAADRLAALAPGYKATAEFAECHPKALEILLSDWLRPEKPAFSACYRRMRRAASQNGWLPIPSERALRRRAEAEVPAGVVTLAREGRDQAKKLYPAQSRIRTHFHAMQAVNMDGHRLDVFVRLHDGAIVRMHLIALQDLFSGKVLAWRLAESENKETVRLVIGDMVEAYGIPDKCWLDNGRAFASKWITGRMPNRFRFTIRDEEPQGLLTTLKVEVHWTTPYSGQSKPIERAFLDLAEAIAKHPFCAGAYTGNSPEAKPENCGKAAIPVDQFRAHVAEQIAGHNAQTGRRAAACAGRSFDETFASSMAEASTIVRWPTSAQKALWLLAADRVRTKRGSGEIEFYGNRYWSRELNGRAGELVTLRFDPERLQEPVKVYDRTDRLICEAECIAAVGFDDTEAARSHARDRSAYLKTLRENEWLRNKLSADELARLYGAPAARPEPQPAQPKIKRVAVAGRPTPEPIDQADFEESFSRGLRLIASND